MRDPFTWSFPLGRLFGIAVKVHLLFPLVALGLILRVVYTKEAVPGIWVDAALVVFLLFFSVLLHELGHCFAARRVGGDAQEILLWPLGGLAAIDVPHTPRAHFLTAAAGPAVNLFICVGCVLALAFCFDHAWQPPWNPFWAPLYINAPGLIELGRWDGVWTYTDNVATVMLARLFFVNWFLFLLNVVLIGYPLDGGRMFQSLLWPYAGYRQAPLYAVYAGFVTMFVTIVFSWVVNEVMPLFLAWFIYESCKKQWIMLETGGEDSLFGYDFSQGYTSLERDQDREDAPPPAPPPKKPGFWQRWLQRRAERKRQKEAERQEAEERRMEELLEKIQREGKQALTDEEQRFLKRVAERYKHRQ